MMTVLDQIANFIKIHERREMPGANGWVYDDRMKVYIRKGYHVIAGNPSWCLDIGNIDVYNQNQGTFSRWFLPGVLGMNPWDAVYFEDVHNRRLAKWLERHGWHRQDGVDPTYYLLKGERHGEKQETRLPGVGLQDQVRCLPT